VFVIHGHWQPPARPGDNGQFLVWAETSTAPQPKPRRGRIPARPQPHPFCATPAEVRDLLARLSTDGENGHDEQGAVGEPVVTTTQPGESAAPKRRGRPAPAQPVSPAHQTPADTPAIEGLAGHLALRLPANKFGPIPSPQLVHDWILEDTEPPILGTWEITGLWLSDRTAFDILARLPLAEEPLPDAALGGDMRYWHVVAGLVMEAVAAQKLAPVLVPAGSEGGRPVFHARWLAVLDGPQDSTRVARLEAIMPPICRAAEVKATPKPAALAASQAPRKAARSRSSAASDTATSGPNGSSRTAAAGSATSPRALLDSFIKTMADTIARHWALAVFDRTSNGTIGLATRLAEVDGAAGRWLRALFGADPRVEAPPAQLQALDRSVQVWLRNLHVAGAGDFRMAFQLSPPNTGSGIEDSNQQARRPQAPDGWHLQYLLQSRSDPSLLLPADEVWRANSPVLKRLGQRLDRPQEQLLAALGYAARLFPPVTRSLKTARPQELNLPPGEAFQFLREAAPLLEQSGFGVLVPPWWNQRGSRLGLRLRARAKKGPNDQVVSSGLSMDRLVEFQWELAVGDTTLTRAEFEALVNLKSPLVQVRGQWVQLDPEQIEAALRFWQSQQAAGDTSLLGALQMGLDAGEMAGGLPVEAVAFEGWLAEWLERLQEHDKVTPLPQPAGLRGQLRPYQLFGYSWLDFLRRYGIGPVLADDMGLGKTLEALALLQRDKEQGHGNAPVLLICPTSVVGNWQREAQRFAPDLTVWVHQGNARLRGDDLTTTAQGHDLVLTSYPLVRRDAEALQAVPWRGVILDEAQNIKNPAAQQTQAIRRLPAGFRLALTGTPVENRLSELWSIMHFLNPGYLGTREHFRRDFAIPIERYRDAEASRRLRGLVSPLILRRVKTDPRVIQDLPDKLEMKVYCNLTEEQASLYEAVVQESLQEVEEAEGIDRRGQVLAMLLKLKQVCDHPVLFLKQTGPTGKPAAGRGRKPARGPAEARGTDGSEGSERAHELMGRSGKLDRLTEMLEEALAAGDRALIFTQFAEMGHVLHGYLPTALGRPTLFLHGGTPAAQRDQMVARFQSPDGPPIFILSLKAGGVGLNLTHANHVFHFDRWWNPAVEDQATDRAFRIGQMRNVQVHKFVSLGTLEEMIDNLIESKRSLAQSVVGAGENWLTELSTDQLRDLVTLRREE
jgi:SNF2 family DNA or RNA helicase